MFSNIISSNVASMNKHITLPEHTIVKPIPQYPEHSISECGKYIINGRGRVITQSGQKINGKETGYIYSTVFAMDYSYNKRVAVHRLVAYTWLPAPLSAKYVWINHKDGNKANNHASNLEWSTISQNIQHAFDTGLKVAKRGVESPLYGRKHSLKTKSIMRDQKMGRKHPKWNGDYIVFGKRYPSSNQAGIALNIPPKTIQARANNPKFKDYSFIPKHIIEANYSVEHISTI